MDLSHQPNHESGSLMTIGRKHPVAARILRRWRLLSGGAGVPDTARRTVVACSGGVDSVGLAVVLSLVKPKPVIAHITHDIRSEEETHKDLAHVRNLAEQLGCRFVHRSVRVAGMDGNLEGNARDARYKALDAIANETGCGYIAIGHQGDDQAETVLMHLLRGAGVHGLGGIREQRTLANSMVIRPMLSVRRAEIEKLCTQANVSYRHDPTNDDQSLTRNRIRHSLIPMLESIREDAVDRLIDSSGNCRDAAAVISGLIDEEYRLWDQDCEGISCARSHARTIEAPVFAGVLRKHVLIANQGAGLDSMPRRSVLDVLRSIRTDSTDPTDHRVGPLVVRVRAHTIYVSISRETGGSRG
ncbi:MAG: tRNA lysidine(34) synthetase TilS [Phycisphaerales bacterium]|nr:tRNA lysidine(34) synthetase TilS [Phycisphaerales bacterium]